MKKEADAGSRDPSAAGKEKRPMDKALLLIDELDFPVGRKLLSLVLRGGENAQVKKHGLEMLSGYGALAMYDEQDIKLLLDEMTAKGLIRTGKAKGYLPVIEITEKGQKRLDDPLDEPDYSIAHSAKITEKDRMIFKELSYLEKYNDMQKKAITDSSGCILCVAGAGTGKTTVLTRRIEFLSRYRSVPTEKILAVTFTRKARREMISRLNRLIPNHDVHVETFNSFSEKLLQKHQEKAYDRPFKVMDFGSSIKAVTQAISDAGLTVPQVLDMYFSKKKMRGNEHRELFFSFMHDIFSLIEHYKNSRRGLSEIPRIAAGSSNKKVMMLVYSLAKGIEEYKEKHGLRDYTDQLVHALRLLKEHKGAVPVYEHILVDEYQDLNDLQIELLDILNPGNLFVVGDPRQSIYGWRGSRIRYITGFRKDHPESTVVQLTTNYRSSKNIVDAGNRVIRSMNLPDLLTVKDGGMQPALVGHCDEQAESLFVAQSILSQDIRRKDIFVLARTNRQLESISEVLAGHGIRFLKRTVEEQRQETEPAEDEITLSTVHAIKGLEAELVFLIGVNSQMYPCQASDNPVMDALKEEGHDRYSEELRLLYVAMTRARSRLVINYYNTMSCFITPDVRAVLSSASNGTDSIESRLREWRRKKAAAKGIRPYMILNDRALLEIACTLPNTYGELYVIKGIGESKIMKYGDEILDIVNGLGVG